jgi:hypothetical protein
MKREELIAFFNIQHDLQQTACKPEIFNIPTDNLILHFITLSRIQLDRVKIVLQQLSIEPNIPLLAIMDYQDDYQNQNTQLFDIFLTHARNPDIDLTWLSMPLNHLNTNALHAMMIEEHFAKAHDESSLMKACDLEKKTKEKAGGDAIEEKRSRAARLPRATKSFPLFKREKHPLKDDQERHQKSMVTKPIIKKTKRNLEQDNYGQPLTGSKQVTKGRELCKPRFSDMLIHSHDLYVENKKIKTEIETLRQHKKRLVAKVQADLGFFSMAFDEIPHPEKLSNLAPHWAYTVKK